MLFRSRDTPVTMDEQIINQVIRPRVMVDCDLVGGTEALVSLEGLSPEITDRFVMVFHIPKDRTQGRSITSVLSLSYLNASAAQQLTSQGNYLPCSVTPSLVAGKAVMDAMNLQPVPSSARVQLVAENTVMIREVQAITGTGLLRCILGNDENFSHLQMRSIPYFCKLCELAVKAYIHNEYTIKLDKARIEGGFELGRFKEVVDMYADSEQQYEEYLLGTWQRVAFMNDRESHERLIRTMLGGFR